MTQSLQLHLQVTWRSSGWRRGGAGKPKTEADRKQCNSRVKGFSWEEKDKSALFPHTYTHTRADQTHPFATPRRSGHVGPEPSLCSLPARPQINPEPAVTFERVKPCCRVKHSQDWLVRILRQYSFRENIKPLLLVFTGDVWSSEVLTLRGFLVCLFVSYT